MIINEEENLLEEHVERATYFTTAEEYQEEWITLIGGGEVRKEDWI